MEPPEIDRASFDEALGRLNPEVHALSGCKIDPGAEKLKDETASRRLDETVEANREWVLQKGLGFREGHEIELVARH